MSEEIAQTNALLIELSRLRTDLGLLRQHSDQQGRALNAERAARRAAEADSVAMRQAIESARFDIHARHPWTWEGCPKPTCYPLREALAQPHPGAQLLTELDAARAVVEAARAYQIAVAELDGIADGEKVLWIALSAYDDATKARDE